MPPRVPAKAPTKPQDARKLLPWAVVMVEWSDAYFVQDPMKKEEVAGLLPCIRRTVGFLMRDDAEFVGVAGTDDRYSTQAGEADIQEVNMIPRGMVKKLIELMPPLLRSSRDSEVLS